MESLSAIGPILRVLQNPDSTADDLVSDLSILQYVKNRNPFVARCCHGRMRQLLALCLENEPTDAGTRAFMMFSDASPLNPAVGGHGRWFLNAVGPIVFGFPPDIPRVSRAAVLLSRSIPTLANESLDFFGTVFRLLGMCDEPDVFDMFHRILSSEPIMLEAQKQLLNARFGDIVLNEFTRDSTEPNRVAAIMRIIHEIAGNLTMGYSVKTEEAVRAIRPFIESDNPVVLCELWRTMTSIMAPANVSMLRENVKDAIKQLDGMYVDIPRYRVFCVEFLAKIVLLKEGEDVLQGQLSEVFTRLLVQFQDSSNLIGAVFRLIKAGLAWENFCGPVIEKFVPLMIWSVSNPERSATSAQSLVLLDELASMQRGNERVRQALEKVEQFAEFRCLGLGEYRTMMRRGYGGRVPVMPPRTLDFSRYA